MRALSHGCPDSPRAALAGIGFRAGQLHPTPHGTEVPPDGGEEGPTRSSLGVTKKRGYPSGGTISPHFAVPIFAEYGAVCRPTVFHLLLGMHGLVLEISI